MGTIDAETYALGELFVVAWDLARFDKLINQTEKLAHRNISLYRLKVTLFAILGYSYLLTLILFFFSPIFVCAFIYSFNPYKNIWGWICILMTCLPLFPFIFSILKSCKVLIKNGSPPQGQYINRGDCPKLFTLIDEITIEFNVAKLKNVLLTDELNASVVQIPRYGIFGWYENYLILGIPLMESLSYDEFKSVLAHEIGHISGNHSKFQGWIFRLREILLEMLENVQKLNDGYPSVFITPFVKWYIPFFNAYTLVLARINEYDAEKFALRLSGAETCALSLIKIQLASGFINNEFWNQIYQQLEYQPKPPSDVYTKLTMALSKSNIYQKNYDYLKQALARKTNNFDTHPSLTKTLKIIGYNSFPKHLLNQCITPKDSAGKILLDRKLQSFISDLDKQWKRQMETSWRERYTFVQEILKEIKSLEEKAVGKELDIKDSWKLACMYLELNRKELVIQQLHKILQKNKDYANAHYLLGKVLITEGNINGVKYIEKALSLDISLVENSLRMLYQFSWERGEVKKANRYRDRLDNFYRQLNKAKAAFSVISEKDKFATHKLEIATIRHLRKHISQFKEIQEAYLVQKILDDFPNIPFYILVIFRHYNVFNLELTDSTHKIIVSFKNQLQIPGHWELLIVDDPNCKILHQVREIKESQIYIKK